MSRFKDCFETYPDVLATIMTECGVYDPLSGPGDTDRDFFINEGKRQVALMIVGRMGAKDAEKFPRQALEDLDTIERMDDAY